MSVVKINKENFASEVLNSNKPVLLDFYADWCGPCRMVGPIVSEIANERSDVKVGKINVDEQPELAAQFQVMSIPMLAVIKNSIHCTAAMFKRYAPGIVDIIFSGCTAKEAIAKCEKSPEAELRSMIREVVGEDMDGSDIETMLARLAANLGISDETEETSSESEITEEVVAESHKESEEEGDDSLDNIVTLQNEEGKDVSFEFLDLMEYEGDEYVVLLPVEDSEGEVVILRLDDTDDESESYTSVDDEETLAELFRIFKEKFKDEFEFVDSDD